MCSATCRNDASEVVTNWEQIKKGEKDDQSLVAGVTAGLPALIAAQKLFRKGASIGLEPDLSLTDAVRQLSGADGPELEACSVRCSRPWSRSAASTTSTRSRRWRAGPAATRTASARWSSSRPAAASISRRPGPSRRDLWERVGPTP